MAADVLLGWKRAGIVLGVAIPVIGLLGGTVGWSYARGGEVATLRVQVTQDATTLEQLGCLPERVARIEATLEAQGDQLDRIEDSLSQRHGGPR